MKNIYCTFVLFGREVWVDGFGFFFWLNVLFNNFYLYIEIIINLKWKFSKFHSFKVFLTEGKICPSLNVCFFLNLKLLNKFVLLFELIVVSVDLFLWGKQSTDHSFTSWTVASRTKQQVFSSERRTSVLPVFALNRSCSRMKLVKLTPWSSFLCR